MHPSVLIRTDALRRVGGYDVSAEPAEDLDLYLRLAEVGRLAKVPETLLQYRVHLKSVGHLRHAEQTAAVARVVNAARRRRGMEPMDFSGRTADTNADHPCAHYLAWAWLAMRSGNRDPAIRYATLALEFPATADRARSILSRLGIDTGMKDR